jgi:hypothetical protein
MITTKKQMLSKAFIFLSQLKKIFQIKFKIFRKKTKISTKSNSSTAQGNKKKSYIPDFRYLYFPDIR